jgi:antitoxin HigA-1
MKMHNPPHPGDVLKTLRLEPLKVSVTETAKAPGVSRKTISAILNGRAGISPEMAMRLSITSGTSAESLLNQQTQYETLKASFRPPTIKAGSTKRKTPGAPLPPYHQTTRFLL